MILTNSPISLHDPVQPTPWTDPVLRFFSPFHSPFPPQPPFSSPPVRLPAFQRPSPQKQIPSSERWVYYRLAERSAPVAVREALDWVHKSLAKTDESKADAKKMKQILKADPSVLCRRQGC